MFVLSTGLNLPSTITPAGVQLAPTLRGGGPPACGAQLSTQSTLEMPQSFNRRATIVLSANWHSHLTLLKIRYGVSNGGAENSLMNVEKPGSVTLSLKGSRGPGSKQTTRG